MSNLNSGDSFFHRLFTSILGKGDPEAERKKQLKAIAKNLSKTKFKFYKYGSDQILPPFGKLIFDLYKALGPAQTFFQSQENPNYYKRIVVDYSLSEPQKKVIGELTEESIRTMSSKMKIEELSKKVKENLDTFVSEFDQDSIARIDDLYSKLMSFKQLSLFDFYFILKKFDSSLKEGEFNRVPDFKPIDASYVSDDLKDFLTILWSVNFAQDWSDVMQLFKAARGVEPVKPATWAKIATKLNQIKSSRIIDMMIQLTIQNPDYIPVVDEKKEQIVESYIEKIRKEALDTLKSLETQLKNSKIDSIVMQIFNTTDVDSMKNYRKELNEPIEKKGIDGFAYIPAMTYLRYFLLEFVKKDVRTYSDLVLIRGKWNNQVLSQEMSNSFNYLMEVSSKIADFDTRHSDEGDFGSKIKNYAPRAERDKEAQGMIRRAVHDSDLVAREILIEITKNLVSFGKGVKALIEDHKKKSPEMVSNWKELERFSEDPIEEMGVNIYKKIYLMVTLVQSSLA